jgi:hypothetical protein
VVPTSAISSSKVDEPLPALRPGINPEAMLAGRGWLRIASGINPRSATTITYIARSQRRKLPAAVTATSVAAASGTARYRLTPK